VCLVVLVVKLISVKKNPKPIEGIDYFPPDAGKLISEIKAEKAQAGKTSASQKGKESESGKGE
jgi:hypothetical protein